MELENLKQFFKQYVKDYQPYQNYPEYQKLVDTLFSSLRKVYQDTILPFSSAFEKQILPTEFYDSLLLSIGFPEEIIKTFSFHSKEILIQNFMDYNRFKGTIEQFRKIGKSFNEKLAIYELWINKLEVEYNKSFILHNNYIFSENPIDVQVFYPYDEILINGKYYKVLEIDKDRIILDSNTNLSNYRININKVRRWYFIPEEIFIADGVKKTDKYIPYHEIYLKTPRFFVSPVELDIFQNSNQIILPIKSNLILLDYYNYQKVNTLYNLFSSIFLKEYYDSKIKIFFKDGVYSSRLGKIYQIWYYLLYKFHKVDPSFLDVQAIVFNLDSIPYKVKDIPIILEEYQKVKSTPDYSKFYQKYISSVFGNETINDNTEFSLYNIEKELIDYIEKRISSSKFEYYFILDELYNSIITWSILSNDNQIKQNVDYFLNNLTKLSYLIDISPSYVLINFLKPYHTDIVERIKNFIEVNDIANSAINNELYEFQTKFRTASLLNYLEMIQQLSLKTFFHDFYQAIDFNRFKLNKKDYSNIPTFDYINNLIQPSPFDFNIYNEHIFTTSQISRQRQISISYDLWMNILNSFKKYIDEILDLKERFFSYFFLDQLESSIYQNHKINFNINYKNHNLDLVLFIIVSEFFTFFKKTVKDLIKVEGDKFFSVVSLHPESPIYQNYKVSFDFEYQNLDSVVNIIVSNFFTAFKKTVENVIKLEDFSFLKFLFYSESQIYQNHKIDKELKFEYRDFYLVLYNFLTYFKKIVEENIEIEDLSFLKFFLYSETPITQNNKDYKKLNYEIKDIVSKIIENFLFYLEKEIQDHIPIEDTNNLLIQVPKESIIPQNHIFTQKIDFSKVQSTINNLTNFFNFSNKIVEEILKIETEFLNYSILNKETIISQTHQNYISQLKKNFTYYLLASKGIHALFFILRNGISIQNKVNQNITLSSYEESSYVNWEISEKFFLTDYESSGYVNWEDNRKLLKYNTNSVSLTHQFIII